MSVTLFRDPHEGAHVSRMPSWVAPKTGGHYWHQPRSASIYNDRLAVRYWCGQSGGNVKEWRLVDDPPEELRCGTCVGRRMGFDRTDGAVFRPRDHWAIPSRCPGHTWEPPEHELCRACGEKVQAARGWTAHGSARHRPGPAFTDRLAPCPRHGWRDIHETLDGRFACRTWQCGWRAS